MEAQRFKGREKQTEKLTEDMRSNDRSLTSLRLFLCHLLEEDK